MLDRTTEITLVTAGVALRTARWAVQSAIANPESCEYALITSKVFSAFMFDGVVECLGEKLCSTWKESRPAPMGRRPRPALSHEPLRVRHRAVRGLLKMNSGDREFQEVRPLVEGFVRFRDSFAHPKTYRETIQDRVRSECAPIPRIQWETGLEPNTVEKDLWQLESYSIGLLDRGATLLEAALAKGLYSQIYPHLDNIRNEAVYLRAFLHGTSHAISHYRP